MKGALRVLNIAPDATNNKVANHKLQETGEDDV
jgi:hypothetical protein